MNDFFSRRIANSFRTLYGFLRGNHNLRRTIWFDFVTFGFIIVRFVGGFIIIGGFIVGVLENILGAYVIGTELKLSVALVLIVVTLTLKPNGLFGKAVVTRV